MDAGQNVSTTLGARRLTRGDLWNIFFRSLLIQSLWNFQRMQNLGWLFCLTPALRRLYPSSEQRRAVMVEHLEYFNTHPYLANLILGVVAGLEEDHAAGGPVRREHIGAAKKSMSGPLAALGDTLFWATSRPLMGIVAVVLGWILVRESWWMVPTLFLILYNVPHLLVRFGGLMLGYRLKSQVIGVLMRLRLQTLAWSAYVLAAGMAVGGLASLWFNFGRGRAAAGVFILFVIALLRLGLSSTQVFYAAATGATALMWAL